MNWLGGKLSRPAIVRFFGYLQSTHPDNPLTSHVASIATSANPMDPTEEHPFEAVDKHSQQLLEESTNEKAKSKSMRQNMTGRVKEKAQTYAFSKVVNLVWSQVTLPLTIFLWCVKLLLSWVEHGRVNAALRMKSPNQHQADVERIVSSIRGREKERLIANKKAPARGHMLRSNDAKKIVGPASALQASSPENPYHLIDLSRLSSVLSIDQSSDTCVVESSCTFRDLLRVTTHVHLMPLVVPPFLDMTIGGAISGGGIGSTSWKKGAFIDSIIEMKVALGTGEVLTVTREGPHSALFHALHSSYHSIGTILSVKLQLVHAPRYVWMKYETLNSIDKTTKRLNELLHSHSVEGIDNLDVLIFSPSSATICLGQGIDSIDPKRHKVITMSYWWEQQYTYYVQSITDTAISKKTSMPVKHCIPLMDFLARYERGAYWQGSWLYSLLPWPLKGNSFVSRLLLGWSLDEMNIRGSIENSDQHIDFERMRFCQDGHIPLHHLGPFLQWCVQTIPIMPIWLCPVVGSDSDILAPNYVHTGSQSNSAHGYHYVNIGLYGLLLDGRIDSSELNSEFLHQVYQAGGRTMLHHHNWHTVDMWKKMIDRRAYEEVRKKYGASDAYPQCYDKIALRASERSSLSSNVSDVSDGSVGVGVDVTRHARDMLTTLDHMKNEIITRKAKFWVD